MNSTDLGALINEDIDYLPVFVVVGLVIYAVFVVALFLVVCSACPSLLKQKQPVTSLNLLPSFADCSPLTVCMPCTDCSFRSLLRTCCPSQEAFRRYASCECCINRTPVQTDAPLNLVCCSA